MRKKKVFYFCAKTRYARKALDYFVLYKYNIKVYVRLRFDGNSAR